MVTYRSYIFHMCISCGKTFSVVSSIMSSVKVKVKYQGNIIEKIKRRFGGIIVSIKCPLSDQATG